MPEKDRLKELAELAISYIFDNGLFDDFCEDRDVEFTEEEKEYFGIDENQEYYDQFYLDW